MRKDISSLFSFGADFTDNYWVKDVFGSDDIKILFILESPHIQEIKHKLPASGISGKSMSKYLFDNSIDPFGYLIENTPKKDFGIMNILRIPMQKQAYNHSKFDKGIIDYYQATLSNDDFFLGFIENLNWLRTEITKKQSVINNNFRQEKFVKQLIINAILADFQERFSKRAGDDDKKHKIKDSLKLIIPCGNVARAFLEKMDKDIYNSQKVIKNIPHPSNNQWDQEDSKDSIDCLRKKIDGLLNP